MCKSQRKNLAPQRVASFLGIYSFASRPQQDEASLRTFTQSPLEFASPPRDGDPTACVPLVSVEGPSMSNKKISAGSSQWPALVRKAVKAVITKDEMVEQPDAKQVARLPQSCRERPILRARCGIS